MADELREETVSELHAVAEAEGVPGHSKLTKDDLVAAIEENRADLRSPGDAANAAIAEYTPNGDEASVSVERLVNEAEDFLGCPRYVAAGALSATQLQTLTVGAAKAAVEAFLGAVVTTDPYVEPVG